VTPSAPRRANGCPADFDPLGTESLQDRPKRCGLDSAPAKGFPEGRDGDRPGMRGLLTSERSVSAGILVLALFFLGATEVHAFGLRHRLHHAVSSRGTTSSRVVRATGFGPPAAIVPPRALAGSIVSASGHCICISICSVGGLPTNPDVDAGSALAVPPRSRVFRITESSGAPPGSRRRLFELHLPNAPPATLA